MLHVNCQWKNRSNRGNKQVQVLWCNSLQWCSQFPLWCNSWSHAATVHLAMQHISWPCDTAICVVLQQCAWLYTSFFFGSWCSVVVPVMQVFVQWDSSLYPDAAESFEWWGARFPERIWEQLAINPCMWKCTVSRLHQIRLGVSDYYPNV